MHISTSILGSYWMTCTISVTEGKGNKLNQVSFIEVCYLMIYLLFLGKKYVKYKAPPEWHFRKDGKQKEKTLM